MSDPWKLNGTLLIPEIWDQLLEIEEISPDAPSGSSNSHDPTPRRDDVRAATLKDGDLEVTCFLLSGSHNYWVEWTVSGPDGIWYQYEPEESLPDNGEDSVLVKGEHSYINVVFNVKRI